MQEAQQVQATQQIRGLLAGLSVEQLRNINSDVVSHINHRQRLTQMKAMTSLHVGQLVEFTSSKLHKTIRIRITKLNQKTVSGRQINIPDGTDMMGEWKVAPSMLRTVS